VSRSIGSTLDRIDKGSKIIDDGVSLDNGIKYFNKLIELRNEVCEWLDAPSEILILREDDTTEPFTW